MNDWNDLKREMFSEGRTCQVFKIDRECGLPAVDLDHALFSGQQKTRKKKAATQRWRNSRYNAQRACDGCNRWARWADTQIAIEHHIQRELERDREGFIDWYYSAPEAVSRKPGSRWKEYQLVVEKDL